MEVGMHYRDQTLPTETESPNPKTETRVEEEKIRRVLTEWLERMLRNFRTLRGCSTDAHIDCPGCANLRAISYQHGGWSCLYRCGFEFPKHIMPPSPEELEREWKRRREESRVNQLERIAGVKI